MDKKLKSENMQKQFSEYFESNQARQV